jgi:acetyl esterase/lipase
MFGPPERFPRSQPVRFARAGGPPALLLHGRDDDTVSPDNSRSLAAALRAAGGDVRLRLYDGVGHAALVGALARPLGFLAPVREAVVRFTRAPGTDG